MIGSLSVDHGGARARAGPCLRLPDAQRNWASLTLLHGRRRRLPRPGHASEHGQSAGDSFVFVLACTLAYQVSLKTAVNVDSVDSSVLATFSCQQRAYSQGGYCTQSEVLTFSLNMQHYPGRD